MNECALSKDLCTCASQEENPSCNATCINNDGSYQCQCSDGYYLFEGDTCIGKLFRKVFIKRFISSGNQLFGFYMIDAVSQY